MSDQPDTAHRRGGALEPGADLSAEARELVILTIEGQLFGVPVLAVRDVLAPQPITRIPLAPPEVAGALNLRGRIVTAIDLRRRLGLPAPAKPEQGMSVVVEHAGELYSLIVDHVSEVMSLPPERFERNPPTIEAQWREISLGIFRLERGLLVVLDVDRLLEIRRADAA